MILKRFDFISATTLKKTLDVLDDYREKVSIIAGGTNLIADMRAGRILPDLVLDIGWVQELKHVVRDNGLVRVGSLVTIQRLANFKWIGSENILKEAAEKLGTPQVRNRATLGGNLANGSPAADTAIPLLCLDAQIVLLSKAKGERSLPISEFFVGPRFTRIVPGEIIREVRFDACASDSRWGYKKLGRREGAAVSVVSLGCLLRFEEERCCRARISLGAVAPFPLRALKAEAFLERRKLSSEIIEECARACGNESEPITDVRATSSYRQKMVIVLVKSLLMKMFSSM